MDENPKPKTITVSANTSGFIDDLWKVRAAIQFGWNPELVKLDDELDILYRGHL
ncbi:hypothetical protein [Streptomyces sp. PD-S100-1]|uniref:hypothetical protein n=1 Tax=Streptomyces sp. PD-S100-1 TaxID=3394351 RepID=UPI0039BD6022